MGEYQEPLLSRVEPCTEKAKRRSAGASHGTGDWQMGQLAGQVGRGADTASSGCVLLGCHELSKDLESG